MAEKKVVRAPRRAQKLGLDPARELQASGDGLAAFDELCLRLRAGADAGVLATATWRAPLLQDLRAVGERLCEHLPGDCEVPVEVAQRLSARAHGLRRGWAALAARLSALAAQEAGAGPGDGLALVREAEAWLATLRVHLREARAPRPEASSPSPRFEPASRDPS